MNLADATTARILVVDDTLENVRILQCLLEPLGFLVDVAQDGPSGLASARTHLPDLILLDIAMPVMDGFEVCRQLKADKALRGIPVIFLTACIETESLVQGFTAGAVDYVTKPFRIGELAARVRTHVELKRTRDRESALIEQLQQALAQVKKLSGLIPICAHCKKIRNDAGYWQKVESYIQQHSEAKFTHGLCPDCTHIYFPDDDETSNKVPAL